MNSVFSLYNTNQPLDLKITSQDPAWSEIPNRIKSLEFDTFCHVVRLSLFNYYDWRFKSPNKSAKFSFTLDGRKQTLTVFPKILLTSKGEPEPLSTDPSWTTYTFRAKGILA